MSQESSSAYSYGQLMQSYIISEGMLVRVGSVFDISRNNKFGIIIKRNSLSLGFNDDWWEVLVNGSIERLAGTSIWPVENYSQEISYTL